jgi:hypothetical protein
LHSTSTWEKIKIIAPNSDFQKIEIKLFFKIKKHYKN